MNRTGLFVIPIRVSSSSNLYPSYLDFLSEAEQHGYQYIFIGEHLTDQYEDIQSSIVFAAALLARTKKIKVALSVLPLTHYNIPLLIKQLEDLERLSGGRLLIGFSPGALASDLEYLNIDPRDRYTIFCEKLREFEHGVANSSLLSEMQKGRFFSTLLSPLPVNASKLTNSGYSILSSNFTHKDHLDAHYACIIKDIVLPLKSDWHIALNLIGDYSALSVDSKRVIIDSLVYIYNKLNLNAAKVMLGERANDVIANLDQRRFEDLLIKKQIVNPNELRVLIPHSFRAGEGALVVNLFDCLSDQCYIKDILSMPNKINAQLGWTE